MVLASSLDPWYHFMDQFDIINCKTYFLFKVRIAP
jgi:hypothetical protein